MHATYADLQFTRWHLYLFRKSTRKTSNTPPARRERYTTLATDNVVATPPTQLHSHKVWGTQASSATYTEATLTWQKCASRATRNQDVCSPLSMVISPTAFVWKAEQRTLWALIVLLWINRANHLRPTERTVDSTSSLPKNKKWEDSKISKHPINNRSRCSPYTKLACIYITTYLILELEYKYKL